MHPFWSIACRTASAQRVPARQGPRSRSTREDSRRNRDATPFPDGTRSSEPWEHSTQRRTLTFSERDKESKFTHIRNTKTKSQSANSQGDVLAYASPLVDAAGTRIGKVHWGCITTVGARDFTKSTATCHGVAALRDGTLSFQFNLSPGVSTTTGAVTGGTGAYANARGVVVSKSTEAGADDTITLVE